MKLNICPICAAVGGSWLMLSAGVAWGYLPRQDLIIPISLLMGGSVVGIAYQGTQICRWASRHSFAWKSLMIGLGMPLSYIFLINLSKTVVLVEFSLMLLTAYFFFVERPFGRPGGSGESRTIRGIEEKMKQCC